MNLHARGVLGTNLTDYRGRLVPFLGAAIKQSRANGLKGAVRKKSLMRKRELNIFLNGGQSLGCIPAESPIIFEFTDNPRFLRSVHYMEG